MHDDEMKEMMRVVVFDICLRMKRKEGRRKEDKGEENRMMMDGLSWLVSRPRS
jgi:hypothetical protein